jgi:hypothetical protein
LIWTDNFDISIIGVVVLGQLLYCDTITAATPVESWFDISDGVVLYR